MCSVKILYCLALRGQLMLGDKIFKPDILNLLFKKQSIGAMHMLFDNSNEHQHILGSGPAAINEKIPVALGDFGSAQAPPLQANAIN